MSISIEIGSYLDFSADLLVCMKNGTIMKEMSPYMTFEKYVPPLWSKSKGGHEKKLAVYISNHSKYRRVLNVSYSPKSNNPDSFATNSFPHGCNLLKILCNSLSNMIMNREIQSIIITPLSWRNPNAVPLRSAVKRKVSKCW